MLNCFLRLNLLKQPTLYSELKSHLIALNYFSDREFINCTCSIRFVNMGACLSAEKKLGNELYGR